MSGSVRFPSLSLIELNYQRDVVVEPKRGASLVAATAAPAGGRKNIALSKRLVWRSCYISVNGWMGRHC